MARRFRINSIELTVALPAILLFFVAISALAGPLPEPIRESAFEYRCLNPDGTSTNHTSQSKAIFACQTRSETGPGKYWIEASRYSVEGKVVTTCPAKPAPASKTNACPAGTTGTWTQTAAFVSAPAPACWTQGPWTPAAAPAGSCPTDFGPKPADQTRQQLCPGTGTWTQTLSYTLTPTGWAPTSWAPASAPAGACTVAPPPPPPPPVVATGWLVQGWKLPGVETVSPAFPTTPPIFVMENRPNVNYASASASTVEPFAGLGVDNFLIRARKLVTMPAGTYTLKASADDGLRVWVGAVKVIDLWVDQWSQPTDYTFVHPGGQVTMTVEHYENRWAASLSVTDPVPFVAPPPPPPPPPPTGGTGTISLPIELPTLNEDDTIIRPPLGLEMEMVAGTASRVLPAALTSGRAVVTGIAAGTYTVRCRVIDKDGEVSSWSNPVTVRVT